MLRDRRAEDLDRLCDLVAAAGFPADSAAVRDPRAWLESDVAERSWVYDMAPAHVTPTGNLVGHVQIYSPTVGSSTPALADCVGRPAHDLLAIGRFVVRPQAHEYGVARHLLKQACAFIERQGRTAVLDLRANGYLSREFCKRYGFSELPSTDPASAPMVHTG